MSTNRTRRLLIAILTMGLQSLTAASCHQGNSPGQNFESDGYHLAVSSAPFRIQLRDRSENLLTEVPPMGIRIGRIPSYRKDTNTDPWLMVEDLLNAPHGPDGLTWSSVIEATERHRDGDRTSFELRLSDGSRFHLTLDVAGAGIFCMTLEPSDPADQAAPTEGEPTIGYTSIDLLVPEGENYYGLGEVFDAVAHRGKTLAMQMEMSDNEGYSNEAHVRIPLLVSSGSWGVFYDTMRPGYLDVAQSDPSHIRAVFADRNLPFCLMAADSPLDIPATYHSLTGPPAMPPMWAFAPIQWRNEVSGQDMVMADATDIRRFSVPTGAIWIDRPYQSTYNSMDFDRDRYPDPQDMVAVLHDWGFRLAGWNSPYLEEADPAHQEAADKGYFVQSGLGSPMLRPFGDLLDLTNPGAMSLWQDRVDAAIDRGIEGFKLDYGEDIQLGLSDARFHYFFYNGEDEQTMNRHYATFYHRAYAEPMGALPFFILARAATIGGQAYASVIWPGDLCSDFRDFGDIDDQGTIHVGGLSSAVRGGIGLSASGFPFYASDTGGFRHGRPTSEVLVRWAEYSALMPIMQYGGGGTNHNPWDFTDYGDSADPNDPHASCYDEQTLDLFRKYASLHIRLFPYFYSLAMRAVSYGRPVVRPWGLAYPNDGRHPDDAFLVGDDLLVAPIVHGGQHRTVPLPEGTWIDWWTGTERDGPDDLDVTADLGTVPLYLHRPGMVPMLRPTIQTLSETSVPGIDSLWNSRPRLWGTLAPAASTDAEFLLHDGTRLTMTSTADHKTTITMSRGAMYDGLTLRVYAPKAGLVRMNGHGLSIAQTKDDLPSCDACSFQEFPWIWVAVAPSDDSTTRFTISPDPGDSAR